MSKKLIIVLKKNVFDLQTYIDYLTQGLELVWNFANTFRSSMYVYCYVCFEIEIKPNKFNKLRKFTLTIRLLTRTANRQFSEPRRFKMFSTFTITRN